MQPPDKPAIIVAGAARCLWQDLAQCPADLPIIAVNYAALFIPAPRLQHLASYHAQAIGLMAQLRAVAVPRYYKTPHDRTPPEVHSTKAAPGVTRVWPETDGGGGSSGLFAVRVALGLDFARVILAGLPMDDTGHFYDEPASPEKGRVYYNHGNTTYMDTWVKALPDFQGRVISCSGMTKTLLGGL